MDVKLTCGNKPMALPDAGKCCGDGIRTITWRMSKGETSASIVVSETFTLVNVYGLTESNARVALDWHRLQSNIIVTIAEAYSEDIFITIVYV